MKLFGLTTKSFLLFFLAISMPLASTQSHACCGYESEEEWKFYAWWDENYEWRDNQFQTWEEEMEWLGNTPDMNIFLFRQMLYSYAEGFPSDYSNKAFQTAFQNPLIEQVVALDCRFFLKNYFRKRTLDLPLLTSALMHGRKNFFIQLSACEDKLYSSSHYRHDTIQPRVDEALLALPQVVNLQAQDREVLEFGFLWMMERGANINAQNKGHGGLFYAALNRHDALVDLYLKHGAEALSENELEKLSAGNAVEQAKKLSAHRARAEQIAHLAYSVDDMLKIIEQFESNPDAFENLPLTARGKIISLMISPEPDLWTRAINPWLLKRRKYLILDLLDSLLSFNQFTQIVIHGKREEDAQQGVYESHKFCKFARIENDKLVRFIDKDQNDYNEKTNGRLSRFFKRLIDRNTCSLYSIGISSGPG
jgi:hypothetical protein